MSIQAIGKREENPEDARRALEDLFEESIPVDEKVRKFAKAFPEDHLSGRGLRPNRLPGRKERIALPECRVDALVRRRIDDLRTRVQDLGH